MSIKKEHFTEVILENTPPEVAPHVFTGPLLLSPG